MNGKVTLVDVFIFAWWQLFSLKNMLHAVAVRPSIVTSRLTRCRASPSFKDSSSVNSCRRAKPSGVRSSRCSLSNSSYIRRFCSILNVGTIIPIGFTPSSNNLWSSWDPSSVASRSISWRSLSLFVKLFSFDSELRDGNKKYVDILSCAKSTSMTSTSSLVWKVLDLSEKSTSKLETD